MRCLWQRIYNKGKCWAASSVSQQCYSVYYLPGQHEAASDDAQVPGLEQPPRPGHQAALVPLHLAAQLRGRVLARAAARPGRAPGRGPRQSGGQAAGQAGHTLRINCKLDEHV